MAELVGGGAKYFYDEGEHLIMGRSQQFYFLFGAESILKEAEYVELAAACTLESLIGFYWRVLLPCLSNPLLFLWLVQSDSYVACPNRVRCAADMLELASGDLHNRVIQSTHECDDEPIRIRLLTRKQRKSKENWKLVI